MEWRTGAVAIEVRSRDRSEWFAAADDPRR
jgi:hypothetical protein